MVRKNILCIIRIKFGKNVFFALCIILFFSQTACKKAVEVNAPITGLVSSTVYANSTTAAAVVTSIYSTMSNSGLSTGGSSISLRVGLSADELDNYNTGSPELSGIYSNSLIKQNSYFWTEIYKQIYVSNSAIEGLTASNSLAPSLKKQLIGEAMFMRAFLHFYAVNLYGDIPLVTSTDYRLNNTISRSPKLDVYSQIIKDLQDAQNQLSEDYLTSNNLITTERIRPNKAAATALLSRVYLYRGEWAKAEAQSTSIINNTLKYTLVSDLNQVFLMNSEEAIWQLQPVDPTVNTRDAKTFVLTSPPGSSSRPVALSSNLKNTFEAGDNRFTNWVGKFTRDTTDYYFPLKYKVYLANQPVTEYLMVMRLAEQYLIRAEAKAQQGNVTDALIDLNVIRSRAGLSNLVLNDKSALLSAILHERQVELFTEWGHRWFDLIRTGNIDNVMESVTPKKGGNWNTNWTLFPIPQSEILINPNLKQNPGYN